MGTMLFGQMKKQASFFLQEKYRTVRLAFTDVTPAELLAEEATNDDPVNPDAKTMTNIAVASFYVDDYWRIVDVLHKRFEEIDWKLWRQLYKSLILLEFLITHGPEEFAEEFQCDKNAIEELGTFQYIDARGFNWGMNMQKRADNILELLDGGEPLREARLKALKISKEIQGFGSTDASSSSSTSYSPSSSNSSRASSFGSYDTLKSSTNDLNQINKLKQLSIDESSLEKHSPKKLEEMRTGNPTEYSSVPKMELMQPQIQKSFQNQESGLLLNSEDDKAKSNSVISGICSKLIRTSPKKKDYGEKWTTTSLSEVGKILKRTYERQFSMGY